MPDTAEPLDRAKAAKKEAKARDKEEAKRRAEAGEPPLGGTDTAPSEMPGETVDESGATTSS